MAKKLTEQDLWDFVNRATDDDRIAVAEHWLREEKHFRMVKEIGGVELWDQLMEALALQYRLLHKPIYTEDGVAILI